jgi:hypothetical protein
MNQLVKHILTNKASRKRAQAAAASLASANFNPWSVE